MEARRAAHQQVRIKAGKTWLFSVPHLPLDPCFPGESGRIILTKPRAMAVNEDLFGGVSDKS